MPCIVSTIYLTIHHLQVDWSEVASQAGYKNAEVARKRFEQIKKKFRNLGPEAISIVSPSRAQQKPNSTPSKSASKGAASDFVLSNDQSPSKKRVKVERSKKRKRDLTPTNEDGDVNFSDLDDWQDMGGAGH